MKKKKVLIVTESVSYGGNNIVAMNIEKHLDKEKFECTYCVRRDTVGAFEEEVLSRGIRVIHVPDSELSYLKSFSFYCDLFKREQFDVIHSHLPFVSALIFKAAKKYGNPKCIAHGHFTQPYNDAANINALRMIIGDCYRSTMRILLKKYCDVELACSDIAGYYLFGKNEFRKNGLVVNNGIEYSRFEFNKIARKKIRDELDIQDRDIVIGHIGLMNAVKNQAFAIDIFDEFNKKHNNSHLVLVGDGPDIDKFKEYASEKQSCSKIHFIGHRNDTDKLYSAFDCFVFPSVHEGFPLTLIEAQASKLSCLVSDNVNRICKVNDNFKFCSLDDSAAVWAEIIESLVKYNRESIDNSKLKEEFDIDNISKIIESIYSD